MKRFRVNQWIRVPEVVVIDEEGVNLGVMKTSDALRRAEDLELDLIEVSPLATPPVCRIMNLGKWQYIQSQKQKKSKTLDVKILRLSFKIGDHDRQVRIDQASKFLTKGHKVKIEMRLRGREKAYPQQGKEMILTFIKDLGVPTAQEQSISMMGGTISVVLSKKA